MSNFGPDPAEVFNVNEQLEKDIRDEIQHRRKLLEDKGGILLPEVVKKRLAYEQLPNGVATLEELQYIFPKLPSAEKVNDNTLIVPVTAQRVSKDMTMAGPEQPVVKLTFHKFFENGKPIWTYQGIVKHV